jgi:hypothetical protein
MSDCDVFQMALAGDAFFFVILLLLALVDLW